MNVLWLVIGALVAWYVFGHHGGDFGAAREEATDWVRSQYDSHLSERASVLWERVRARPLWTLATLAIVLYLIFWVAIPALQPKGPDLRLGENSIKDACGNEVIVWVLDAHTGQADQRVEITPLELGQRPTIQKPGSPKECALELPPLKNSNE